MDTTTVILLCIGSLLLGAVIAGIIAFRAGIKHRKNVAEAAIGSAETEAKRIVSDSIKGAEARKKEILLEAKDEIHKLRSDADKDIRERRSELQRQERRLTQKEESMDRKLDNLEKKEENLGVKLKEADDKLAEVEILKKVKWKCSNVFPVLLPKMPRST